MSVLAEFEVMLGKIGDTIEGSLEGDIADFTKKTLQESMQYNVYSYQASPWAMSKRRGDMGGLADKENMQATVTDVSKKLHTVKELQVESTAGFQGSPADYTSLDEVVETGNKAFKQPYPRTFYADTEKHVVNSGMATQYLADGLIKAGFDVQVL